MSTYNGWQVISIPTTPPAPASIEFQRNALVAANTNPFSGAQQVQAWNSTGFMEASVSMPPMPESTAQQWITFLIALNGPANVFTFPTTVVQQYPVELTTDGTTARYWRLKTNQSKWSVQRGSIYAITFEIREAI